MVSVGMVSVGMVSVGMVSVVFLSFFALHRLVCFSLYIISWKQVTP